MSYLDQAINYLDSAMKSGQATFQEWSQEWQNTIDNMKAKAQEFISVFNRLEEKRNIAAQDAVLNEEYQSLMSRGSWIKDTIEAILPNSDALAGLGALPLIPIAAVLAAVAAIAAWLAPAYVMLGKIELAEKALAQGQPVAPILEAGEGGFMQDTAQAAKQITKAAVVIGGGFLLWKFWPELKRAFK